MCPAGIEECIRSSFLGSNAHSSNLKTKRFLWALGNFPLRPGCRLIRKGYSICDQGEPLHQMLGLYVKRFSWESADRQTHRTDFILRWRE